MISKSWAEPGLKSGTPWCVLSDPGGTDLHSPPPQYFLTAGATSAPSCQGLKGREGEKERREGRERLRELAVNQGLKREPGGLGWQVFLKGT